MYKNDNDIDVFIDVSRIPEMKAVETLTDGLSLGGAVERSQEHSLLSHSGTYTKVAGHGVRNLETIGGNLVTAWWKVEAIVSTDLLNLFPAVPKQVQVSKSNQFIKRPSPAFSRSWLRAHD